MVRTGWPLRVTVTSLVRSSYSAISASPVRKDC